MSATQHTTKKADERRQDQSALEIDVIMEGGVIQEILGIPPGARVRVIDYDTEGADPADLTKSPYDQDNKCFLGVYTGTPTGYRFSPEATQDKQNKYKRTPEQLWEVSHAKASGAPTPDWIAEAYKAHADKLAELAEAMAKALHEVTQDENCLGYDNASATLADWQAYEAKA